MNRNKKEIQKNRTQKLPFSLFGNMIVRKAAKVVLIIAGVVYTFVACNKQCAEKAGYTVTKDGKKCVYTLIPVGPTGPTGPTGPVDPYAEAKEECAKKNHPDSTYTWNDALKLCEATYIGKPPVDCTADSIAHVEAKAQAEADSIAILNHMAGTLPIKITGLMAYYKNRGMSEEEAFEAALRDVRDYPESFDENTINYANTYWGLVAAFNASKAGRESTYLDWMECVKQRDE